MVEFPWTMWLPVVSIYVMSGIVCFCLICLLYALIFLRVLSSIYSCYFPAVQIHYLQFLPSVARWYMKTQVNINASECRRSFVGKHMTGQQVETAMFIWCVFIHKYGLNLQYANVNAGEASGRPAWLSPCDSHLFKKFRSKNCGLSISIWFRTPDK